MADETGHDVGPLVAELTLQIYGRHVHAGRAYASVEYALHCAAVIVGAAQSPTTLKIIEEAKASPSRALERLERSERRVAEQVDEGRRRQVADLVAAIKVEEG